MYIYVICVFSLPLTLSRYCVKPYRTLGTSYTVLCFNSYVSCSVLNLVIVFSVTAMRVVYINRYDRMTLWPLTCYYRCVSCDEQTDWQHVAESCTIVRTKTCSLLSYHQPTFLWSSFNHVFTWNWIVRMHTRFTKKNKNFSRLSPPYTSEIK